MAKKSRTPQHAASAAFFLPKGADNNFSPVLSADPNTGSVTVNRDYFEHVGEKADGNYRARPLSPKY